MYTVLPDGSVRRDADNIIIPQDMTNMDWIDYQNWLVAQGTPPAADPPAPAPVIDLNDVPPQPPAGFDPGDDTPPAADGA